MESQHPSCTRRWVTSLRSPSKTWGQAILGLEKKWGKKNNNNSFSSFLKKSGVEGKQCSRALPLSRCPLGSSHAGNADPVPLTGRQFCRKTKSKIKSSHPSLRAKGRRANPVSKWKGFWLFFFLILGKNKIKQPMSPNCCLQRLPGGSFLFLDSGNR